MKTLDVILATIATLEEKQWNFTITFEEERQLRNLIELAQSIIK